MKLEDLEKLERKNAEQVAASKSGAKQVDLPGVRSSPLVKDMEPTEKKSLFDEIRQVVDEAKEHVPAAPPILKRNKE